MLLEQPTGGGDTGTWDDKLNANNLLIDAHDHSTGKGTKVTAAGLNITTDLSLGAASATAAGSVDFTAKASSYVASRVRSLYVDSGDNELYWVTSGGTRVKLTLANSINTALVGGITGDYASTDADVNYEDANKRFRFYNDDSPQQWASLYAGNVALHEAATSSISNRVLLKSPAALAASYDVTFPAAVPASSNSCVQMSTTGVLSASPTPTLTSLTTTSTVTAGGLITASAGLTGASGQHVTVAGSGRHKHGTMEFDLAACDFVQRAGSFGDGILGDGVWTFAATTELEGAVRLPVGARVISFTAHSDRNGAGTLTYRLKKRTLSTVTTVATLSQSSGTGWTTSASAAINYTMEAAYQVWISVVSDSTSHSFGHIVLSYDFP